MGEFEKNQGEKPGFDKEQQQGGDYPKGKPGADEQQQDGGKPGYDDKSAGQ